MVLNKILEIFKDTISRYQMITVGRDNKIVVGCSGGPDSMMLLHSFFQLKEKYNIEIVPIHINHLLRDSSSEEATKLSCYIKDRYGLTLHVMSVNVRKIAREKGMGIEECGRFVRQKLFKYFADYTGAYKIALGHNLDDQAETVLFRIARGTGIVGLSAMKPVSESYIRPLLFIDKNSILEAVKEAKLFYLEDSSNYSFEYDRNVLRHKIIPELEHINVGVKKHLFELSKKAWEVEDYIDKIVTEVLAESSILKTKEFWILKADILEKGEFLSKQILRGVFVNFTGKKMGVDSLHLNNFYEEARGKRRFKMDFPQKIVFARHFDTIVIKKNAFDIQAFEMKAAHGVNLLPYQMGSFELINEKSKNDAELPDLVIRFFRNGDMFKNKKLKEFLYEADILEFLRHLLPSIAKGKDVIYMPFFDGNDFFYHTENFQCKINFVEGELYCKIKDVIHKWKTKNN